jgi:tyrosyl-tRNA synthetase
VAPLITTASGAKFGKSETGAVYLDPRMTSPYKFYQFWVNADDRDIGTYLRLFSLRPRDGAEGVAPLLAAHAGEPARRAAQHALATEMTERVHGKAAAESVAAAAAILFSEWDPHQAPADAFDVLAQEIPTAAAPTGQDTLVDAVVAAGLAKSKSEARRQIEQGGVYVNQQRESDPNRTLQPGDWLAGGNLLLRKGKKDYALLRRGP